MYRAAASVATAALALLGATLFFALQWGPSPGLRRFLRKLPVEVGGDMSLRVSRDGAVIEARLKRLSPDPDMFGIALDEKEWLALKRGYYVVRYGADDAVAPAPTGPKKLLRISFEEVAPEQVGTRLSAWNEHKPVQPRLSYIVDERIPALAVLNLDVSELTQQLGEAPPPPGREPFSEALIMPLHTFAEGDLAVDLLFSYAAGHGGVIVTNSDQAPPTGFEALALWSSERVGSRSLAVTCAVAALLAALFWLRFGWQVACAVERYRGCLTHPGRFAAWFAVAPAWRQRSALHALELERSEALLNDAESRAGRERSAKLASRKAAERPVVSADPVPPSAEAVAGLVAALQAGLLRPELAPQQRDEIAAEVSAALAQRNRSRSLRMLEHAHGRLVHAIADAGAASSSA